MGQTQSGPLKPNVTNWLVALSLFGSFSLCWPCYNLCSHAVPSSDWDFRTLKYLVEASWLQKSSKPKVLQTDSQKNVKKSTSVVKATYFRSSHVTRQPTNHREGFPKRTSSEWPISNQTGARIPLDKPSRQPLSAVIQRQVTNKISFLGKLVINPLSSKDKPSLCFAIFSGCDLKLKN